MIIGTVEAASKRQEEYPAIIDEAIAYLRSQDFTKLAEGRYYPRGKEHGEEIFADVQRYESTIMLKPGSFAVLFPEDVHAPRMATEAGPGKPVTKVVVKISVDLL